MAKTKKSGLKTFIQAVVIMVILGLIIIFAWNIFLKDNINNYFKNNETEHNDTIIIEETNNYTTINNPGKLGLWDFLLIGLIVILGFVFLRYFTKKLFELLNKKKLATNKHKQLCITTSREELKKKGYKPAELDPKFDFPYYGGDSENNPVWAFGFIEESADFESPFITPYELITCCINTKTLEIFNPQQGRSWKDFLKELRNQRFGINIPPNFPGKTEKEPSFEDLFNTENSSLNIGLGSGGKK